MKGDASEEAHEANIQVERAVDGDQVALAALLQEHAGPIAAPLLAGGALSGELETDDLVQITSIEAILRIKTLQTRTVAGFCAWFRTLAQNNLRDAARSMGALKRTPGGKRLAPGPTEDSAHTLFHLVVGEHPTASAIVSAEEQVSRMMAAIDLLPRSYATVIRLLDLEEADLETVAASMSRSKGAVHMLRMRAHARLRELL